MKKWFRRRRSYPEAKLPQEQTAGCIHPLSHQIVLTAYPLGGTKGTAIKCTQCGKVLSSEDYGNSQGREAA